MIEIRLYIVTVLVYIVTKDSVIVYFIYTFGCFCVVDNIQATVTQSSFICLYKTYLRLLIQVPLLY